MKKPDEIKKLLAEHKNFTFNAKGLFADALAYIQRLEADRFELQTRIHNQKRQLRKLHATYEWALSVLIRENLNDRAELQYWLRERGFNLSERECPQLPKEDEP